MRIAVIGRTGQLAQAVIQALTGAPAGGDTLIAGPTARREQFDLADPAALYDAICANAPDAVINAGAYTKVDAAETDIDTAMMLNAAGPEAAARACAHIGAAFVHVSTDYVFDGAKLTPYEPHDALAPINIYGRSKADGEARVLAAHPDAVIIRTSWVYGAHGANFLKTMLRLAEARDEISIVADQIGRPTWARDLAAATLAAARARLGHGGATHYAGADDATWADFAEAIFAEARARSLPSAAVKRIATQDYPTPARRPANSRLDSTDFTRRFGLAPRPWRDALTLCMDELAR